MNTLFTGHEAEMAAENASIEAFHALPLAERQIAVMRSRIESALEYLTMAGGEDILGNPMSADRAVANALRNLRIAIENAERQS